MNIYVAPFVKERTKKLYYQQINKHIVPCLGDEELENLTNLKLQKAVASLTNDGYAANTVNGIINILKKSLKDAAISGMTLNEYGSFIKRPKGKERKIFCFTKKEQSLIEGYILNGEKTRLYGVIICFYTGMRIGELLSLKWEDIDFKKRLITVSKTCADFWKNGNYIKLLDAPKTLNSQRIVPFPKQLTSVLKEIKEKGRGEYVIFGKSNQGVSVRSYQKSFENLLNKLKIEHRGFHSTRHTFATRALECGMDVKTLSVILGHQDPQITLKRYAHSLLDHRMEMVNRLGKLLER